MALDIMRSTPTLTVNDLTVSVAFYCEGLGFTLLKQFPGEAGVRRSVILLAGSAYLGLTQDDFSRGRDRLKGVGVRLFLETTELIEVLAERVSAAGISIGQPTLLPWGVLGCSLTDPDGFALTICERQPR